MGSLGDGIGVNDGDNAVKQRQMRTAPLCGLRFRKALLRDGRTTSVATAIRAHTAGINGQGSAAAAAFATATQTQQQHLLLFLSSL